MTDNYKERLSFCKHKMLTDVANYLEWKGAVIVYQHLIDCPKTHSGFNPTCRINLDLEVLKDN